MTSTIALDSQSLALTRARQVFNFLKAFAERNIPIRRSLRDHDWVLHLSELPNYPAVFVGSVTTARVDGEDVLGEGTEPQPLMRIKRPLLTEAPTPPAAHAEWIVGRWSDPFAELQWKDTITRPSLGEEAPRVERFDDIPERRRALEAWFTQWRAWGVSERPARTAMEIFNRFYALYGRIERESERVELMLGDGRLRHTDGAGADHPVLLQRVELQFDPNVPEFCVVDADRIPELYTAILQEIENVSGETLNTLRQELEVGGFHPLGDNGTTGYLNRLANSLSSDTRFLQEGTPHTGSTPTITRDRVLLLRPRMSGMSAALDRVLEDLDNTSIIPSALSRVVGIDPSVHQDEDGGVSVSPWGEPPDVLFSKPANLEQVRIARALERHHAVLVQGPPGTGKSHTIANLIGDLVAAGQRVLVTSQTTKALRVLRGHIVEELRPLCVSLLDQDLDGRAQLEQAVRGIIERVGATNEQEEAARVERLTASRTRLIAEVERLANDLRIARTAEYEQIVVDGESLLPAQAARIVRAEQEQHAWLPGPLVSAAPVPLAYEQLARLYESNEYVTAHEERELTASLPPRDQLLEPPAFAAEIGALDYESSPLLTRFWARDPAASDIADLVALNDQLIMLASESADMVPWQRTLVAAGRVGETERTLWRTLSLQIKEAAEAYEQNRECGLTYEVQTRDTTTLSAAVVAEMREHARRGGTFGAFHRLFRGTWKGVLEAVTVDGQSPSTEAHFTAILTTLQAEERRRILARRWDKQAEPIGLPAFASLSDPPERLLLGYVGQFDRWLGWWEEQWTTIQAALEFVGFRWVFFREHHIGRSTPTSAFEGEIALVAGPLREAIATRLRMAQCTHAEQELTRIGKELEGHTGEIAATLRRAIQTRDASAYADAYDTLVTVENKSRIWKERRDLLAQLEKCAPAWAAAIRERRTVHGDTKIPGDVESAWRWRQLTQELERRASLDEIEIAARLHEAQQTLRTTTIELIDAKAWLEQLRRTDLTARQALMGWSDTQKKIGKGTGKRVPELQAKARELLSKAREAVPVWIMPLTRVAENFDPRERKFDVVIVDEASQSNVTGLLAFYLGARIVVVGDHEQVSPLAVGEGIDDLQALRVQHLIGVPNQHLYDGRTSIYDLARQSFGGTIVLREHFRCVPSIIDFSNYLSYDGQILPLRDPATAPQPHVVEYVVPATLGRRGAGKVNEGEARLAASIIAAMCSMPEYRGKSIGAISLVGEDQALCIQELALSLVDAVTLDSHRFATGNPAQFQGDERHIILLSMVDSPTGSVLRLRADEPTKQRYNVAVSRAKNQLWLLHSLDLSRDLQPGDLRRRLIEHVRDPNARRRAATAVTATAESVFEREVIQRLDARGYRVRSQVEVGHYRLDMVVSDGNRQVAIECDGDRYHPIEKIPEDLMRQAILERTGWRFVRLRGTRFFRDPEAAMDRVYADLARFDVHPSFFQGEQTVPTAVDDGRLLREEVFRRAWQIMMDRNWVPSTVTEDGHPSTGSLVLAGVTTESVDP